MEKENLKKGWVDKLCRRRGFGFITSVDQERYFLHIRNTKTRMLFSKGQFVVFEVVPSPKPGQLDWAINVEAL